MTLDSEHRAPDLTLGKKKTQRRDKDISHGFGGKLLLSLRDLSLLSSRRHVRRDVHAEQILRDCDDDCEDLWRRGQGLSSSTCELSHELASSAPQPQTDCAGMTPQRRTKMILRKLHTSECTEPANSYTVHDPSRCSGPVGGTRKRWLAEEVDGPDPQRSPTI